MKRPLSILAAGLVLLAPGPMHAQTAAVTQPPVTVGECPGWSDTFGALIDSGVGCANNEVKISDGTHGTMVFAPSNLLIPNSPAILNDTAGQPLLLIKGVATTASDAVDFDVRRIANYSTGGTAGFVNTALRVFSNVTADRPAYEWAFLAELDNNQAGTQGSQNVAGYFQSHKRFATASTWALTAEMLDHVADPSSPSVTFEYDLQSKGTDVHTSRVIQDLFAKSDDGNATVVSYGQRFNTDAHSTITHGIWFNGAYGDGINLSNGAFANSSAAMILADGQKICTTALCVNYLVHSTGSTFVGSSGGNLVSFSDTGQIGGVTLATSGNIQTSAGDFVGAAGKHLCLDGTCGTWLTYVSGSGQWQFGNLLNGTLLSIDGSGNTVAAGTFNATAVTGTSLISTSTVAATTTITAGGNLVSTAGNIILAAGKHYCMDASCNVYVYENAGIAAINVSGVDQFAVDSTGHVGARVGFSVNTVSGVNCSGAPSGAFAASGGIVTHC